MQSIIQQLYKFTQAQLTVINKYVFFFFGNLIIIYLPLQTQIVLQMDGAGH